MTALTGRPPFANSANISNRLPRYLGLAAEPLYHPPPLAGRLQPSEQGDCLFAAGRPPPDKRVDLMIAALAQSGRGTCLVIAGTAENPAHCAKLGKLTRRRPAIVVLPGLDLRPLCLRAIRSDDLAPQRVRG